MHHRHGSALPLALAAALLLGAAAVAAWPADPTSPSSPTPTSTPASTTAASATGSPPSTASNAATSATSATTSDDTRDSPDEADEVQGQLPWLVGALWEPFAAKPSIIALGRPEGDFVYLRDRGWLKWDGRGWAGTTSVPGDLQRRYPFPEQHLRDE